MRRVLPLLLLSLVVACSATGIELGETDDGGTVEVSVDETITVTLPSNPTTGFSWQVQVPDQLRLVSQTFQPDSTLIGAGGVEVIELQAVAEGTGRLELSYERPFEEGSQTDAFEVTVTVTR